MSQELQNIKNKFFYPTNNYRGKFTPGNLAFNANLQEFYHQVSYLCNLEANGKITPEKTYFKLEKLWNQLKQSKRELLDCETIGDRQSNANS